ncbi:MAG: hypothetical protein AABX79_00990 [Nanoarchaeota archaeon]
MKISMILVKVLILGALLIISNQNLHILVPQERGIFLNSYSDWITSIAGKIVDITGNVVKLEWIPR